tara:strand:+ start:163 stop:336 length:174 start_codon:yes stop_codon:yes gene_type:complete
MQKSNKQVLEDNSSGYRSASSASRGIEVVVKDVVFGYLYLFSLGRRGEAMSSCKKMQ